MFRANDRDGLTRDYRGLLVAEITAVDTPASGPLAGRPVYSWTEQTLTPATGGYEAAEPARRGVYLSPTSFNNVLLDANDTEIAVGQYVWARLLGLVGGTTVYETVVLNDTSAGSPGGGSAGDCLRKFRSMRETDCIGVEVTAGTGLCAGGADQSFDGVWSAGAGGWVGDEYVWTPLGLGLLTVWRDTDGAPAAKLAVGGTDYRGTYAGCTTGGRLRFLFGDDEMCPDASGSGAGQCDDHVIEVTVGCAPCEIEVCDDPDYTMPRRLCFLAEDLEASVYGDGPFTLGAVAVSLVYRADYPADPLDWQPQSGFAALSTPATDQWWYGEADAEITASSAASHPQFQVGETYRVRVMLSRDRPDGSNCTAFTLIVRAGTTLPNGYAMYYVEAVTGGPPNPLPFTAAPPSFLELYGTGVLTAAEIALTEGECPGDTGGGAGDSACCMEAGESLEAHPDLEVVVPDGANAGTYTATWTGTRYEFDDPGPDPVYILCSELLGTNYLDMVNNSDSVAAAASSVSCDPFGAVFPGSVLGSVAPITVALA